jgi:hypothetical protein
MKPIFRWRPGRKNADRSVGTVQAMSPATELFNQVSRVRAGIV